MFDLWWTPQKLPQPGLGQSSVTLSQRFFEQLVEAPVPLDLRAIKALKKVAVIARSICLGQPARQLFEETATHFMGVFPVEFRGRLC
jgi:Plasmid encoded RepA protein